MEVKIFKKLFDENCKKLGFEKFKTTYFKENDDSIIFLILRKSGYSTKYYLRVKVNLKPLEENFNKSEFIKHDISDILLSLDSELPEIFDLESNISDDERILKINIFFDNNVKSWIKILKNKDSIKSEFLQKNHYLLPYTKEKLNITE